MARTKASVGAKVSSFKSSKARCSAPPAHSNAGGSSERSSRSHSGGNPACPRETPKWQKPITNFFINKDARDDNSEASDTSTGDTNAEPRSSKSKLKRNIIESDNEDSEQQSENKQENPLDKPKNAELDETLELEPLTGDECHKIDEYYSKNDKGKGVGKKTKNKENIDINIEKRSSMKRDLEDITFGEESEHARKKVKLG